MNLARTINGDVETSALGRVDYHEHLFQVSPLLLGDELEDVEASTHEAVSLRESGFESMVDATPIGLGRRPADLARASAIARIHVIATTGAHRAEHYSKQAWVLDLSEDRLASRFIADITNGMPVTDVPSQVETRTSARAGLLKVGIGYWRIGAFERRVASAVAAAHAATGAPVMVHTEHATATHEVLNLLADLGVGPAHVALAHVDRNLDSGLHVELASRGCLLGYDGPARARSAPDSALIACFRDVVDAGYSHSLLLGGDVARASRYLAYGGMPGLSYLGHRFVPRLVDEVGAEVVNSALRSNPHRWLGYL